MIFITGYNDNWGCGGVRGKAKDNTVPNNKEIV